MNRSTVYRNTSKFLKGKWLRITMITILITYVLNLLTNGINVNKFVSAFTSVSPEMTSYLTDEEIGIIFFENLFKNTGWTVLITTIVSLITSLFRDALSIDIKEAYENDKNVGINSTINHVKKYKIEIIITNFMKSLITGLIMGSFVILFIFISALMGPILESTTTSAYYYETASVDGIMGLFSVLILVLFIGVFTAFMYIKYAFDFVPYVISSKPGLDTLDIVKEAFEMSKGQKFSLFAMDFNYNIRTVAVVITGLILLLIFTITDSLYLFVITFLFTILAAIATSMYYRPYSISAKAIYYVELDRYNSEHYDAEYEKQVVDNIMSAK